MYMRAAVLRLDADSEPVSGRRRAFRRNAVTFPRKPDACRTLAAAGRFEGSGRPTSVDGGVDGSSPSEGLAEAPHGGAFRDGRNRGFLQGAVGIEPSGPEGSLV